MDQALDGIEGDSYVLAPDLILTPVGPVRNHVMIVRQGKVAAIERRTGGIPAIALPDMAIMPGIVDSHAHAGQTFGKSLIGGEPSHVWRRLWVPLEHALTPERRYVSAKWMFLRALCGGFAALAHFKRN